MDFSNIKYQDIKLKQFVLVYLILIKYLIEKSMKQDFRLIKKYAVGIKLPSIAKLRNGAC